MKVFYDVDRERLLTVVDLMTAYGSDSSSRETFPEFREKCMTYNGGSIAVYSVVKFGSTEALNNFVTGLLLDEDRECHIFLDGSGAYVDTYAKVAYMA